VALDLENFDVPLLSSAWSFLLHDQRKDGTLDYREVPNTSPELTASVWWINTNHDKELIGTLDPYVMGLYEIWRSPKSIGESVPI